MSPRVPPHVSADRVTHVTQTADAFRFPIVQARLYLLIIQALDKDFNQSNTSLFQASTALVTRNTLSAPTTGNARKPALVETPNAPRKLSVKAVVSAVKDISVILIICVLRRIVAEPRPLIPSVPAIKSGSLVHGSVWTCV